MESAIVGKPAVVIELIYLHDQRVTLPVSDRVPESARIHISAVRTAIDGNNPKEAAGNIVV